jgi:hypothetical protein
VLFTGTMFASTTILYVVFAFAEGSNGVTEIPLYAELTLLKLANGVLDVPSLKTY